MGHRRTPLKGPVMRGFEVFFDDSLHKLLNSWMVGDMKCHYARAKLFSYREEDDSSPNAPYFLQPNQLKLKRNNILKHLNCGSRIRWPHVTLCCALLWLGIGRGCHCFLGYFSAWWHHDVIKWKYFPRYWPFVTGIHRSPVDSPHKGQWRGDLVFSLICAWANGCGNNRDAGDLRPYRVHYDVIVMDHDIFSSSYTSTCKYYTTNPCVFSHAYICTCIRVCL